jgi:gliding motility-associated lipoprotein GldD
MSLRKFLLLALPLIALASCGGDDDDDIYTPKPKGYFRISFPEKTYTRYDSICPFAFDYPVYARIEKDMAPGAEPCWININYPKLKAQIHLSYKQVNGSIDQFLKDARTLAMKHTIKADAIEEQPVVRDSSKVYGLIYNIEGNAASSIQFYLTDSTTHTMRGALYFNTRPNKDSLGIVIDFIREDIHRMIQSFEWKEDKAPKAN